MLWRLCDILSVLSLNFVLALLVFGRIGVMRQHYFVFLKHSVTEVLTMDDVQRWMAGFCVFMRLLVRMIFVHMTLVKSEGDLKMSIPHMHYLIQHLMPEMGESTCVMRRK